jgi:hypothetical protein
MSRLHQLGEDQLKAIRPEQIDWAPFAAFPPGVTLAVLVGDPAQAGPYVIRVRASDGAKLMPHRHAEDRIYTVISGIFYIGFGDQFSDNVIAHPPGTLLVLPGDTWHFHWAKSGEYVTQVYAIGPLALEYASPNDDPRRRTVAGG